MKNNFLKSLALLPLVLYSVTSYSAGGKDGGDGGQSGGGGDASEMGVDLIRADILKWITAGGAATFKEWPKDLSGNQYETQMKYFLEKHRVVVGFVSTEQEKKTQDPEQKVIVEGRYKSCRGFISKADRLPHILCNSDRYPSGGANQYRLIHHEYAGLAGIEKNLGASSDYILSNQMTDFLVPEVIYRLAVKRNVVLKTQSEVCISKFRGGAYGPGGSYDTTCPGQKTFTTWVGGKKQAAEEKLAEIFAQRGFVRVGAYFGDMVLVHMNGTLPTDRFCVLASKQEYFDTPAAEILDCSEGALAMIEPSLAGQYLMKNGLQLIFTHGKKESIPVGMQNITAELKVFKKN